MTKKAAVFLAAMIVTRSACAAPPQIEALNGLPNAGTLYVEYCSVDGGVCESHEAIAYGQVCDQAEADDMGYGCSGDIKGRVSPGMRYARWHCIPFDRPTYDMPLRGEAGPKPAGQCTNPR